jgi:ribonuclease E
VGRVDGFAIVVADAAKRVGKKATVVVGRVVEGQAFATLVGGEEPAAPITFESEAEKPTRAPSRRKTSDAKAAPVDQPVVVEEAERIPDGTDSEPEAEDAEPAEAAEGEAATPTKKRTRRGSRGGRRRKKPATAAAATGEATEPDLETESEREAEAAPPAAPKPARPRKRTPRIHVPDGDGRPQETAAIEAELAPNGDGEAEEVVPAAEETTDEGAPASEDGGTPKKRTRRGSRGGRNRKRKPATPASAEGEGTALAMADSDSPVPRDEPARGDEYVPMSEWIDDIES